LTHLYVFIVISNTLGCLALNMSDILPIWNGLKQGDALSPVL